MEKKLKINWIKLSHQKRRPTNVFMKISIKLSWSQKKIDELNWVNSIDKNKNL